MCFTVDVIDIVREKEESFERRKAVQLLFKDLNVIPDNMVVTNNCSGSIDPEFPPSQNSTRTF